MYTLLKVSSHPFSLSESWSSSESDSGSFSFSQKNATNYQDGQLVSNSTSLSSSWSASAFGSYERVENCKGTTVRSTVRQANKQGSQSGSFSNATELSTTVMAIETVTTVKESAVGYSQDSVQGSSVEWENTFTSSPYPVTVFTTTKTSNDLITVTTSESNVDILSITEVNTTGVVVGPQVEINITKSTYRTDSVDYVGQYNRTVYADKNERLLSITAQGTDISSLGANTVSEVVIDGEYISRSYPSIKIVLDAAASFLYTSSVSFKVGFSTTYKYTYISYGSVTTKSHTVTQIKWSLWRRLPMETETTLYLEYINTKTAESTATIRHGMELTVGQVASDSGWIFPTVTAMHGSYPRSSTSFYTRHKFDKVYVYHPISGSITTSAIVKDERVSYSWTTFEEPDVVFKASNKYSYADQTSSSYSFVGTVFPDRGQPNPYTATGMNNAEAAGGNEGAQDGGITRVVGDITMVTKPVVRNTPNISRSHVYKVGVVEEAEGSKYGLIYTGATLGGTYRVDGETLHRPDGVDLVRVATGLSSIRPVTNDYVTISKMSVTYRPHITTPTSRSDYASKTRQTSSTKISTKENVNSNVVVANDLSGGNGKGGTFLLNVFAGCYTNPYGDQKLVKEFFKTSSSGTSATAITVSKPIPHLIGIEEVNQDFTTSVSPYLLPQIVVPNEEGIDKV